MEVIEDRGLVMISAIRSGRHVGGGSGQYIEQQLLALLSFEVLPYCLDKDRIHADAAGVGGFFNLPAQAIG